MKAACANMDPGDALRKLVSFPTEGGECDVVLWTGEEGRGKSTLAMRAASLLISAAPSPSWCRYVRVTSAGDQRRRARVVLEQLVGRPMRRPCDRLWGRFVDVVAQTLSEMGIEMIFVDEAHLLGVEGLEVIEHLASCGDDLRHMGHAGVGALVLVGDPILGSHARHVAGMKYRIVGEFAFEPLAQGG